MWLIKVLVMFFALWVWASTRLVNSLESAKYKAARSHHDQMGPEQQNGEIASTEALSSSEEVLPAEKGELGIPEQYMKVRHGVYKGQVAVFVDSESQEDENEVAPMRANSSHFKQTTVKTTSTPNRKMSTAKVTPRPHKVHKSKRTTVGTTQIPKLQTTTSKTLILTTQLTTAPTTTTQLTTAATTTTQSTTVATTTMKLTTAATTTTKLTNATTTTTKPTTSATTTTERTTVTPTTTTTKKPVVISIPQPPSTPRQHVKGMPAQAGRTLTIHAPLTTISTIKKASCLHTGERCRRHNECCTHHCNWRMGMKCDYGA